MSTAVLLISLSVALLTAFQLPRLTTHTTQISQSFLSFTLCSAVLSSVAAMYVWVITLEFPHLSLYASLFYNPN